MFLTKRTTFGKRAGVRLRAALKNKMIQILKSPGFDYPIEHIFSAAHKNKLQPTDFRGLLTVFGIVSKT